MRPHLPLQSKGVAAPWLVLAVLGLGACQFTGDASLAVSNHCRSDEECGGGICDATIGRCVASEATGYRLAFRVRPLRETTGQKGSVRTVPSTYGPGLLTLARSGLDLEVPGTIAVVGDVCVRRGTACAGHVSANVSFSDSTGGLILPEDATAVLTGGSEVIAIDGEAADYTVRLMRDREYEVFIEPLGPDAFRYHPVRTRIRTPRTGDATRIGFLLWDTAQSIAGHLVDDRGDPARDLRVEAVDRASRQRVSSTSVSDEGGSFSIWVDPLAQDYLISISPSAEGQVTPTLLQDPATLFPGPAQRVLIPTGETFQVSGEVVAGGESPVADAVVDFQSIADLDFGTGQQATFASRVSTDARGRFSTVLFPGRYRIVVRPPVGREDATILVLEKDYRGGGPTMERWVLPVRALLAGEVTTPLGAAATDVLVSAAGLRTDLEGVAAAPYNRSNDRTTGQDGLFRLPVDEGRYDLSFRPPAGSGFSWVVRPDQAITREVSDSLSQSLPSPVVVAGRLRDEAGVPLGPAEVEAYALVPSGAGALERPVLVARSEADDTGAYTMYLPPSLE